MTTETDKQFVERIFSGWAFGRVLRSNEDADRLRALALRGAETQVEIEQLLVRVKELEGQHKGLVMNNAMLRQRHDLPADRIPAASAYEAEIALLRAALTALGEPK